MTREEAIAIIRKEYLCVDRDCDIERSCGKCDLMMPSKEPILEAYKMAIKALEQMPAKEEEALLQKWRDNRGISMEEFEDAMNTLDQEPCEDAISRAEAVRVASGYCHPANVAKELAKLPSVNPQPCEDAISRQAVLDILKREGHKWGNDYRDWVDAIEEIKNLSSVNPTKTGWIPVSERLPENCKEVLVTDDTDIFTGWYKGDKWCSCYEEFWPYSDPIVAWMPLPKPYEPQERSGEE